METCLTLKNRDDLKKFKITPKISQNCLSHSPPDDPTLLLSIPVSSSDISMSTVSMSSGPFIPRDESLFMLIFRLYLGGMDGVGNKGGR